MWVVHVDDKGEDERASLVHAFIGSNCESEVKKVGRVREVSDHSRGEVELSQILRPTRHQ